MAEGEENVPPDVAAPEGGEAAGEAGEGGEGKAEGEQAEEEQEKEAEVVKPITKMISAVSKWGMKKGRVKAEVGSDERVDVDRTALNAILDVSSRLKDIQKKSRVSMSTLALGHESYKDKQVNKLNT